MEIPHTPALRRVFLATAVAVMLWTAHAAIPAWGGTLTIETQTTTEVKGKQLAVTVSATNKGTAEATRIQVRLNVPGGQIEGPIRPRLAPGDTDTVAFEKDVGDLRAGRYPLVVSVDFHDADQYPFSAVSGMTFYCGKDVNPDLVIRAKDLALAAHGEIAFDVKNLAAEPREIHASLVIPKELSAPEPGSTFRLDPRVEKTVSFAVTNFSALKGASYPTFCFFEYDLKDSHRTAVARSLVRIVETEPWFKRTRAVWIGASLVLIALIVLLQVRRRRS